MGGSNGQTIAKGKSGCHDREIEDLKSTCLNCADCKNKAKDVRAKVEVEVGEEAREWASDDQIGVEGSRSVETHCVDFTGVAF